MSRQKSKRSKAAEPSIAAEWKAWYVAKRPVLLFVLKFALWMGLFYVLSSFTFFDQMLYTYLKANAWAAGLVLRAFGQHAEVSDVIIRSPQFSIAIRRGCDAVEPTWLLCAAIVSFPSPLLRKLPGILAGIVFLQALNLVRIVTLYWIGLHFSGAFNSAHLEIWPTVFIVAAVLLFLGWIEWSGKHAPA